MEIRVAVVGSGVASLMAARTLCSSNANVKVVWFTARRKMGATQSVGAKSPTARPIPGRPFFDYGCQYMSPHSRLFARELERWKDIGLVADDFNVSVLDGSDGRWQRLMTPGHVGKGGMGPMLEALTLQAAEEFGKQGLEHVSGFPDATQLIVGLVRDETQRRWYLSTQKAPRAHGPFDYVIGAFGHPKRTDPFLQTAGPRALPLKNFLKGVRYNQFFALQLVIDNAPTGDSNLDKLHACHVVNDSVLSFISDNSKKPHSVSNRHNERPRPPKPHLTLVSTAQFAESHARMPRKQIQTKMLSSLAKLLMGTSLSSFQQTYQPRLHRLNFWQDGRPTNVVAEKHSAKCAGHLWDPTAQLAWCGDFCVAPCVDGAAQSGAAAGKRVLDHILERRGPSALGSGAATNDPRQDDLNEMYRWIGANEPLGDATGGMVDIGYFKHVADNVSCSNATMMTQSNQKASGNTLKQPGLPSAGLAHSESRTGNMRRKRNRRAPKSKAHQRDGSQIASQV